ncbi:MAG TPA: hypothetical protein VGA11_01735 [Acidimicrobiia bacterium]
MTTRADRHRAQRERRRRVGALVLAAVLLVAGAGIAAVALSGHRDSGAGNSSTGDSNPGPSATGTPTSGSASTSRGASTTVTASATTSPPTTTTLPPLDIERRYSVGTESLTFVDPSRSTSANGDFAGAATRTFPTEIWYPATGDPGGEAQSGAEPDRAHGPYPLVLFAHGYAKTPTFYEPLLVRWAAAGYVVAAPTFPILSGTPGGASHTDYDKTFGDASFVLGKVLELGSPDVLAGMIDPHRVAATGHSDGEVIAFGVGFLQCCRDSRVNSVIAMAGDLSNINNPIVSGNGVPILHIMETNDEFDPYDHTIAWDRENLTAPRWMLTLVDAGHAPPYTQADNPFFPMVSAATIDFLDGTLKGHPERLDRMGSDVNADVAKLER